MDGMVVTIACDLGSFACDPFIFYYNYPCCFCSACLEYLPDNITPYRDKRQNLNMWRTDRRTGRGRCVTGFAFGVSRH